MSIFDKFETIPTNCPKTISHLEDFRSKDEKNKTLRFNAFEIYAKFAFYAATRKHLDENLFPLVQLL
jgi:hypothetical protein